MSLECWMPRLKRGHDSGMRDHAFPRHKRTRVVASLTLVRGEGAGNTGCEARTHSLACTKGKHTSIVTTGQPLRIGVPCAVVLTAYLRALAGVHDLLVTVACSHRSAGLAPAQGRHDHTTSPSALRRSPRVAPRPPHPAPNVRDDGETPLFKGHRTTRFMPVIWGGRQAIF